MSTRKIRQLIETKDDISNAFDDITYSKGAAVIGMFENWMGAEAFRKGVQSYLNRYAFRTATGVHAAAVIKAYKKNDIELANTVYSGVPSHVFGLEQVIDIGPMSGKSNVLFWLDRRGIPVRVAP